MGKETTLRPMLMPRETPDLDTLPYPVYVTPKLDGIRVLFKDGVALSRTLKPIPNKSIQKWAAFWGDELEGMDGELIVGSPPHLQSIEIPTLLLWLMIK